MEKIVIKVNNFLKKILVFLIGVMIFIVVANTFCRYFLHFSLTWSSQLARYCMVWFAFIGACVLVNEDKHLSVQLFDRFLKGKAKEVLKIVIAALSAIFFIVLTFYGIVMIIQTTGQVASSMNFVPMGLVYACIPVSGLLMFLGSIWRLYRLLCAGDD